MVRIGFGRNAYKWFARIDLWWVYLRLSRNPPKPPEWLAGNSYTTLRKDGLYQLSVHTASPLDSDAPPSEYPASFGLRKKG